MALEQRIRAHKAIGEAMDSLYREPTERPADDETVDPDVLAYVLATTEGLEREG